MNFSKLLILILLVSAILPVSCKNRNREVTPSQKEIKMVEIPKMITDPEAINHYAIEHFWDNFDFGDSTLISISNQIDNHTGIYIYLLASTTPEVAVKSISDFTTKFLRADKILRDHFLKLIADILYDPNSQMRNEEMYIAVLETIVSSDEIDSLLKGVYDFQLELALKNRPGEKAIDFGYMDSKGRVSSLYGTKGKYTLIFFFNPGCPHCIEIKATIINSPILSQMGSTITYLAVYSGDEYEAWTGSIDTFPANWIVSHDMGQGLDHNRIYDLRASPTMYLLDENKTVLLKDPPLFQIENYMATNR